jgi:hypothetical protein
VCWVRLVNGVDEALAEHDGELIRGLLPRPLRQLPFFFNIAQSQKQQLGRGLITG